MLTAFFSLGDDAATSTLDVIDQMFATFGAPIYLILAVGIAAMVIVLVIKAMIK